MNIESVCREVREIVGVVPPQSIEVVGQGPLASELRHRVASRRDRRRRPFRLRRRHIAPLAILETTGTAGAITGALARVANGGTIVLLGDRTSPSLPVNLYTDVHVRGIRVIGVPTGRQPERPAAPVSDPLGRHHPQEVM